jgi:hypothetical protein
MDPRRDAPKIKAVPPFATYIVGVGFTFLVFVLMCFISVIVWRWVSGASQLDYIPIWLIAFPTAIWFFLSGNKCKVEVGDLGVPKLLGQRVDKLFGSTKIWLIIGLYDNILSEGNHWLFPRLMGFISVDHKIQTSGDLIVTGLSQDRIWMTGKMYYRYQITKPFEYLSAQQERMSLDEIGLSAFRDQFADKLHTALIESEQKSHIATQIDLTMRKVADESYGIGVILVGVENISVPTELEQSWTNIRTQEAKRDAEKISNDAIIARIKDVITETGMTPEKAAEFMQIERGLIKAESIIFRLGDQKDLSEGLKEAIRIFMNR